MLTDYIDEAMKCAEYERMEDDEGWFATIPGFPGLWAHGKTIEDTRRELASALQGWIVLGLRQGDKLPVVAGLDLTPPLPSRRAS